MVKQHKSEDNKKHWQSQNTQHDNENTRSEALVTAHATQGIANVLATLQKISIDLASLEDIRRATALVECKFSLLITRMVEGEKRVKWLEDVDKKKKPGIKGG